MRTRRDIARDDERVGWRGSKDLHRGVKGVWECIPEYAREVWVADLLRNAIDLLVQRHRDEVALAWRWAHVGTTQDEQQARLVHDERNLWG